MARTRLESHHACTSKRCSSKGSGNPKSGRNPKLDHATRTTFPLNDLGGCHHRAAPKRIIWSAMERYRLREIDRRDQTFHLCADDRQMQNPELPEASSSRS